MPMNDKDLNRPMNAKDLSAMTREILREATKICAFCVHAKHEMALDYWCFEKECSVRARETCKLFADPPPFKRRRKRK